MLKIGTTMELEVMKQTEFGVYLGTEEERVLLPGKQVPEGCRRGDRISVFLYRDSSDRLISTTKTPLITLGETAVLEVREVGKIGAFLDWGLEKDLLLPFKEQTKPIQKGEKVLVALYEDKTHRLAATMKVYPYLKPDPGVARDAVVTGRVYEVLESFGAFVAVEDQYLGMIPRQEFTGQIQVGQVIQARVAQVREDGKLTLSLRKKAYMQMDEDAEHVLEVIGQYQGILPYDDKASPEVIAHDFALSKAAFKRAVGKLLKEQKIKKEAGRISLLS